MGKARHRGGRPYQRARRQMFAIFGDVCHICLHHGATEADHLTPISLDEHQPIDPYRMRPAHGTSAPCPTCGRKCNQERGNRPVPAPLRTSRAW